MTERETLERCAKAMRFAFSDLEFAGESGLQLVGDRKQKNWNPLRSVSDAAEMAIKMKVDVHWGSTIVIAEYPPSFIGRAVSFKYHPTEQAAYCYAVCAVVAQMGGE